jgi:hypothetical protein
LVLKRGGLVTMRVHGAMHGHDEDRWDRPRWSPLTWCSSCLESNGSRPALHNWLLYVVSRIVQAAVAWTLSELAASSRFTVTHRSSLQADLHLLFVWVILLNPLTAWRYGCPSLTLWRLAGCDPMRNGTAMLHNDWLDR